MSVHNIWMSVSDLMTGLMVVFLFISIAYVKRVQENQIILAQFVDSKKELHDELHAEFKKETLNGNVTIDGDLTMRFQNTQTLFATGSADLTPEFQEQLSNYIPRYLDILLHTKIKNDIKEIRIEGHTDDDPYPLLDPDPYFANLILSQRRALSVMRFIRELPAFQNYSDNDKRLLEFWFTANGLSYGRALDKQAGYVYHSNLEIDKDKSRRVEFRLITSSDKVLEEFVSKIMLHD